MSHEMGDFGWPIEEGANAMRALAQAAGWSSSAAPLPRASAGHEMDDDSLDQWFRRTATVIGIEAERVDAAYGEVEELLAGCAPALVRVETPEGRLVMAVLRSRTGALDVVSPDFSVRAIPIALVYGWLCAESRAIMAPKIDPLLTRAGVPPRRCERVRQAIMLGQLHGARIGGVWLLRSASNETFRQAISRARVIPAVLAYLAAYSAQYVAGLVAWVLFGRSLFEGAIDRGWMMGWTITLLTIVPCRAVMLSLQGRIALRFATILKTRLMQGALRFDVDAVRKRGIGELLAHVFESEALEGTILSGGTMVVAACLEAVFAFFVLAQGIAGIAHASLLVVFVFGTVVLASFVFRKRERWSEARMEMTNHLVERMAGHRTRLVQESPERWHEREEAELLEYGNRSREMDRISTTATSIIPRAWMVFGCLGLAPALLSSGSPAGLAVGLGGVMLGFTALSRLVAGLTDLGDARAAWKRLAPLLLAARQPEWVPLGAHLDRNERARRGDAVVEASEVSYQYDRDGRCAIERAQLTVQAGSRLLIEGPSGGGKSTLASLLVGFRPPSSGLLLLHGLDRQVLGDSGWRERIVAAPQFHDNHVFEGSLAFNLLMGRDWPPKPSDLALAREVCDELGLGGLIERMPGALEQLVGDTGWQLSHGERSRVFIARALLQRAGIVLLDESFGALDPHTLRRVVDCVNRRAETLIVVAHP